MIQRVLVGLGGTEFTPVAIRRAIDLAQRHKAEITGVTVMDESRVCDVGPVPVGGAKAAMDLREHRLMVAHERMQAATEEFQRECHAADVRFSWRQESGEPFALLTDLARYHDVMIFGLRSVFDCDLGFDPQDALSRLVRSNVRPLIAVSQHYREIRRVLLTYSGSPESAKAIKRFIQSQLWPNVSLRLLTCGQKHEEAHELLGSMSAYCRSHGYEAETAISDGAPGPQIINEADAWDADLIVLGNSVRNVWMNKLLGSTAQHVIQNAERPLYLSQ